MRENGGSLDFNFLSLPSPVVELGFTDISATQVIFRKCCCIQLKLFVNGSFTEHFHYFCVCVVRLFSFFIVCSLLNHEYSNLVKLSFLAVCSLILGYAVRIFCTNDAKYVIFVSFDAND